MKPNLFLHNYKIYRLKYRIPKFEMSKIKIGDFTSAESWAILPRKMAFQSRGTTWQQPVTSIWVTQTSNPIWRKESLEKQEARGGRYCVARARNGRSYEKHEEKGISNALVSN